MSLTVCNQLLRGICVSNNKTGHLGKLSLSLHWMNLGNQPVEVLVEDVYLLVVPSSESTYNPEEEERRAQAAKFERLENAELLHVQARTDVAQGTNADHEMCLGRAFNSPQIPHSHKV